MCYNVLYRTYILFEICNKSLYSIHIEALAELSQNLVLKDAYKPV